ncbi:MAG: acetyl-CoA hydrolase/transferase family protein [Blastocatellia bacterium]|nr:acetyl-CoA hydrolase/transferase family protein [Blastocatellia bacterium]
MTLLTKSAAADAVKVIKSNDRVFIHGVGAAPQSLIKAMVDRSDELTNVEIVHLHTEGPAPYSDPQFANNFRVNAFFVGANIRAAVKDGRADYIPVFLSEIPALFRKGVLPLDVALIHTSLPDKHGFCSLGVSVDIARAAVDTAKHVIAQVNPKMPRTLGDALVHVDEIDAFVDVDEFLPEAKPAEITDVDRKIGGYIAEMIDDGATLQMGIGSIPNAVLASLGNHKHLGIHTEMFSDGLIDLVESGIVTGERKIKHPGKIVSGFVMGTQRLYDFIDDNPQVLMLDIAYVNDTSVIRRNPKVTAINSAIEVDLTGQICADSIGPYQYSGVGGQMDFIRGASLSEGGKPIIALPSTTSKGDSKIVPFLNEGAGVVTTRAHVHYVVTEYGVADLYGKNLQQRAAALTAIAHPDHRETLDRAARERFKRV